MGDEISTFAESAIVEAPKKKKGGWQNDESFLSQILEAEGDRDAKVPDENSSWTDLLDLIDVLEAFGCLIPEDESRTSFRITNAGDSVGTLSAENALWLMVGLGGAWDVTGASSGYDDLTKALEAFDSADIGDGALSSESDSGSQAEAEGLISRLLNLNPSEMAGYVAGLTTEPRRNNADQSAAGCLRKMSAELSSAFQAVVAPAERFQEVQRAFLVEESASTTCRLELPPVEVVTKWAAGCSWEEALEISGLAPGDLARTLHRVLDTLRQIGTLSPDPLPEKGTEGEPRGVHPGIRLLCREAAKAIDRYPVKEPLLFDEDEEGDEDTKVEEDENAELTDEDEEGDEDKRAEGNEDSELTGDSQDLS